MCVLVHSVDHSCKGPAWVAWNVRDDLNANGDAFQSPTFYPASGNMTVFSFTAVWLDALGS